MVPPPIPMSNYLPDLDSLLRRGQRRNFYQERYAHPHKFPIGACVSMHTPQMRLPIGPMYVVEHCKPLYPHGPPQYILQPSMHGDNSKWIHANERHLSEADPEGIQAPYFQY